MRSFFYSASKSMWLGRAGVTEYSCVGRLNEVVSLVSVFEELSFIPSPFGSRDKVNQGIRSFHEQVLRRAGVVIRLPQRAHGGSYSLCSRSEKSKWYPPFCCMDFSVCSLNTCDSCITKRRNLVPTRIVYN